MDGQQLARVRTTGLALAVVGAIGFSGKAIIIKLAYQHGVDAVTLIMLRMALALPLFLGLAWWAGLGKPALTRHQWWSVVGLGFCGYYLSSMLDFLGLQYITASLERLILYLNPTLVLLLGWALFGRRATWQQGAAMAVGYAGVLLVFAQELRLTGANVPLGAALVFTSAITYAVYLVYSGEVVKRLGALRLTGLATSVACLLCMVQFVVLRPLASIADVVPAVWWLSLLNATLCTFVPVLAMMMALERIGSTLAAQVGMLGPLSTIALGAWLLGEPLTAGVLAGTVLVLVGVGLLARLKR
jgi:drug/metabolite transporter (DMT)-like permease